MEGETKVKVFRLIRYADVFYTPFEDTSSDEPLEFTEYDFTS